MKFREIFYNPKAKLNILGARKKTKIKNECGYKYKILEIKSEVP